MGIVTVKDKDGKEKQFTVTNDTEALILAQQETQKAIGTLRATMAVGR